MFAIFILMSLGSKSFGWMRNSECFRYLGCNVGFFGYDALVHFVGGITIALGFFWLGGRHSKNSFFHDGGFWKNLITILAITALIGITWEMLEYSFDMFRTVVLHIDLFHPINQAAQASNSDTMGDLTFGLLGALVSAFVVKLIGRDVF